MNCPTHNVSLIEKKGTSKETGKFYHFFGCPTWKETGCKFLKSPSEVYDTSDAPNAPRRYTRDEISALIKKIADALDKIQEFIRES